MLGPSFSNGHCHRHHHVLARKHPISISCSQPGIILFSGLGGELNTDHQGARSNSQGCAKCSPNLRFPFFLSVSTSPSGQIQANKFRRSCEPGSTYLTSGVQLTLDQRCVDASWIGRSGGSWTMFLQVNGAQILLHVREGRKGPSSSSFGSKTRYQNGTLASGNMDQHLRFGPPV